MYFSIRKNDMAILLAIINMLLALVTRVKFYTT